MALLSQTPGTPERIWSLLQVLRAHDGVTSRENLSDWLNPDFKSDDGIANHDTAFKETVSAANGLGLIDSSERDDVKLTSSLPGSYSAFPSFVHQVLSDLDHEKADNRLFEVFAAEVIKSQKSGSTLWAHKLTNRAFAEQINDVLMDATDGEGDRLFNDTKVPHWRRWMEFLGLYVHLPTKEYVPSVTECLDREVIAHLKKEEEIDARSFMAVVGEKMPYLDGGEIHKRICSDLVYSPPEGVCSPILSNAIVELEESGKIKASLVGDSSDYLELSKNFTGVARTFNLVKVLDNA